MLTFCNLVSSTACWETPKNRVLKLLSLYDLFPSPLRLVLPCVLWFYSDVFSEPLFIYCVMVRGLLSTLQVLSYSLDSLSVHEPFLSPTLSSFHSSPSLLPSPISPSLPLPPGYNCISQCGLKLMIPPATEIDICPANTVFFLWVFFFFLTLHYLGIDDLLTSDMLNHYSFLLVYPWVPPSLEAGLQLTWQASFRFVCTDTCPLAGTTVGSLFPGQHYEASQCWATGSVRGSMVHVLSFSHMNCERYSSMAHNQRSHNASRRKSTLCFWSWQW